MTLTDLLPAVVLLWAVSPASADCIDINADPIERLTAIVHIDDERAAAIVAGRPWPGVLALTEIKGIGRGRIRDIAEEGLACVRVRAPVAHAKRFVVWPPFSMPTRSKWQARPGA